MVKKKENLLLSTTIKGYSTKRRRRNRGILVPQL
jgi:hypothetical protein